MGFLVLALVLISYTYIILPRNKVWLSNRALYESMIKTAPNSLQGHQNMAQLYLEENRVEEARREVEVAFDIYKEHAPLLNLIGIIAYRDENYDLAETAFLKAIELRPSLDISFVNIGRLYYQLGEYDKAEESLRNVVKLFSRAQDALLYALTLAKLERYEESLEIVNNYFKNNLDNDQIRFAVALNYYKMGNLDEAKKYFDWNPNKTESEKIEILENF